MKTPIEQSNSKFEQKERTPKEIYEEFWELIDDDNPEFQEFILADERRKNKKKLFDTS